MKSVSNIKQQNKILKRACELYKDAIHEQKENDYYWNDKTALGERMQEWYDNFQIGWEHKTPVWLEKYIEQAEQLFEKEEYDLYLSLKQKYEKEGTQTT